MRLIQLLVPTDRLEAVRELLGEEDIDYVATREADGDGESVVLYFPLPTQAVDAVLEDLRATGLDEDGYTVIANAETAITPDYEKLEERFVDGREEDESISNDEIRAKAKRMTPDRLTYYAMTLLSAFVATAGLLLDSPAVVVGSMVIAPQVGSALTASVGTTLGDRRMLVGGVRSQAFSLLAAILAAAAFGWFLKTAQFVPPALSVETVSQISGRTSPGLLTLVVGVCAGAAGAFGLATEFPVSLVGVAVAAALIPAAAAVGIGVAWALPAVALGALVVVIANVVSINLAAFAVFWYLGYRPDGWDERDRAGRAAMLARSPTAVALVVGLLVLLVGPGTVMAGQISFENDAKTTVQDLLAQEYDELELRSVHVEFGGVGPVETRREVTVTVARPDGSAYPSLADEIGGEVAVRTGKRVTVTVEFVDRNQSGRGD
ncbi:TIGR00341 family protein [Halegenticoccus soli]|uniref:TIGR00341 family protein n=1 Tax=Halegenticoccus soli TaxID=1985678 RepID=UPI000C6D97A1|nr:TIGR00341 family protein [Halegenticoccus soli]